MEKAASCGFGGIQLFDKVLESTTTADLYVIGVDSNVAGDEAAAFHERLLQMGFQLSASLESEQVTVAKQRTIFQTQVHRLFLAKYWRSRMQWGDML